jgi:drug/metabolite transporter (DMT)-like permease
VQHKQLGIILLLLTAVFLASSTIIMKHIPAIALMTPGQVGVWRFLIAAPPSWIVLVSRKPEERKLYKGALKLMGLGLVFSVASFSALFALERLSSSLYILILYLYPSLVILYKRISGRPIPRLFWLGLPLTLVGLFLITYSFGSVLVIDQIGIIITLINAVALAVYMILSERVFRDVKNKISGTAFVMTGAMLIGLSLAPIFGFKFPPSLLGWILLISLGIFGTLIPIYTLNLGLQYLGAARGSVIVTLQPVLAVLFSTLVLGESLFLHQWIGGLLVIVAVILIQTSVDNQGNNDAK